MTLDFCQFKSTYERRAPLYKRALFSYASVRQREIRQLLRGTLAFTDNTDRSNEILDYGELVLEKRYLTCDEALGLVEGLTSTPTPQGYGFEMEQMKFQMPTWRQHERLPAPLGFLRLSSWPSEDYLLGTGNSRSDPNGPLANPELPLVISPRSRIDEWIGIPPGRLNVQTGIIVLLPDYRARITKVRFDESGVKVSVDSRLAEKQILARAAVDDHEVSPQSDGRGKDYIIMTTGPLSSFHFFLFERESSEVIDWAQVYLSWSQLPPEIEFSAPEKQFERLIQGGESQELEFKKERGDGFAIVQSIIAFANTNPGTILIGVDDNGHVVGTDPDSDTERIVEWIERKCDPPIPVSFDTLTIDEEKVLSISVQKGNQAPYVHRDNGVIYVRRGSTDRHASRTEIQSLFGTGYRPGL